MHRLKLLIADDHSLFANGLKLLLKEQFEMDTPDRAVDGREAISKCLHKQYDIVLMDVNMPVIDGVEATRQIKKRHPEVKVLIVSMLHDFDTLNKVFTAGADGFLVKDADEEEFEKAFRTIMNDKIYLSATLSALYNKDRTDGDINRKDYIQFTENIVTPREQLVLKLITEGFTNEEIASTLSLSTETVKKHRTNMLVKLDLPNTAALVKFAIDNKLV